MSSEAVKDEQKGGGISKRGCKMSREAVKDEQKRRRDKQKRLLD